MAKFFAISDLMNNKHALALQNIRFYFNPVTNLAEPIGREWESLTKGDPLTLSLFLEEPKRATRHFRLERDTVLRMIYNNIDFKYHYLREAEFLCKTSFLDQFLLLRKDTLEKAA